MHGLRPSILRCALTYLRPVCVTYSHAYWPLLSIVDSSLFLFLREFEWKNPVGNWFVMSCDVMWRHVMSCVKRPSTPRRTVVEETFWTVWHHHYDVTGSRDVGKITIRLPWEAGALSYRLSIARNPVYSIVVEIFSLKWLYVKWLYDVITDVVTPGLTIRETGALRSRCLC